MYAFMSNRNKCIGDSRIKEDIAMLYPPAEREKEYLRFKKERRNTVLKFILTGMILMIVLYISNHHKSLLENNTKIRKNAYGEGSRRAELVAVTGSDKDSIREEVMIEIPEKQYTLKETETLFVNMLPELEETILAENETLDNVSENLNFVKVLEGYPFRIAWESSCIGVIDLEGIVNTEEIPEKGQIVSVTAEIKYGEFRKEYIFPIRVVPKQKTATEIHHEKLQMAIERSKEETMYDDYFMLPEMIDTTQITWEEKQDNSSVLFLLLFVVAGIVAMLGKNQELHKKLERRNKELLEDYPEIVSKLVLLTGAGMTLRGAFFKIATDYKKKKVAGGCRYAYEEIVYLCNEMDAGVAEAQAYINWGKRCYEREYIKLSMLLVQNLKRGSHRLIDSLQEEVKQAFADKKAAAKRAGEEAGTKLLVPMGLMLLIVMVFIIVPAFSSFGL